MRGATFANWQTPTTRSSSQVMQNRQYRKEENKFKISFFILDLARFTRLSLNQIMRTSNVGKLTPDETAISAVHTTTQKCVGPPKAVRRRNASVNQRPRQPLWPDCFLANITGYFPESPTPHCLQIPPAICPCHVLGMRAGNFLRLNRLDQVSHFDHNYSLVLSFVRPNRLDRSQLARRLGCLISCDLSLFKELFL